MVGIIRYVDSRFEVFTGGIGPNEPSKLAITGGGLSDPTPGRHGIEDYMQYGGGQKTIKYSPPLPSQKVL